MLASSVNGNSQPIDDDPIWGFGFPHNNAAPAASASGLTNDSVDSAFLVAADELPTIAAAVVDAVGCCLLKSKRADGGGLLIDDGSSSSSDQLLHAMNSEKRWIFLGLVALPVWILFGNLLVLMSVIGFRHLRTLSNWVIASLAFTDFLLALTVVPFGIYQLVNQTWDLGLAACLFWTGSDVFLSTTSIMHLCAIAIHRHLGIAYPLRMRRGAQSRRHVLCLLLPPWTVSAAVSASLVVQGALNRHPVLVVQDGGTKMACGIYDRTFAVYSSMVSFFVPLAVMVAADFRSVQILRSGRRRDFASAIAAAATGSSEPSSISMAAGREMKSAAGASSPKRSAFATPTGSSPTANSGDIGVVDRNSFRSSLDVGVDGGSAMITVSVSGGSLHDCEPTRRVVSRYSSDGALHQLQPCGGRTSEIVASGAALRGVNGSAAVAARHSRGYVRFLAVGRTSFGVVGASKLNGRERRAGKTLVWVFAIFVALWLPFFCTNLAYGLCGPDLKTSQPSARDAVLLDPAPDSSATAADHLLPVDATTADPSTTPVTERHSSGTCNIPEAIFVSFTWLGYLSSGVNPLLYTALNTDFQNAFRLILTCGYRGATAAGRRISRVNLFG